MAIAERVLILGLDGATWTVLEPLRRLGLLPNLDALLAGSARGTLRSTIPPVTTAAWTTMQTGCSPARHGVFDHRYYDPASDRMRVSHADRIRVPTLWKLLTAAGRSIVSLNLPGTYPPPAVRGLVVSGMDAPHLEAAVAGAPEFARRRPAEAPDYQLNYYWKRPPESFGELRDNARLTVTSFLGRADGGLLADKIVPDWSALLVQFQNLDPFQHRAWHLLNVDETGVDRPDWNAEARGVVVGLDRAVGRLLELADRRGAAVLVVSDHGFGPCLGRIHANRILMDAGVARAAGPLAAIGRRASRVLDLARLGLAKHSDPTARTSSFDASVTAQYPLDWRKTRAFAPHQDTAAMVYLNRRPGSPLRTPRLLDEARNDAAIAFASARHPENGKPLFPQVLATAEEYGVDPAALGYPDLIALPDDPYWVRTKLAPGRAWVEPDPQLPGTHRPEGIVVLRAPGVVPGQSLAAKLIDATPTVLALLGEPIPSHVEGRPIAVAAPTTTSRHDRATPTPPPPHRPTFEYSPEEQAIIEQRLADLGYLE